MTIRVLLAMLVSCLLSATAAAQPAVDRPADCDRDGYDPFFADYPNHRREAWPQEALRIAANHENVERQDRRLRLRLDDGQHVELVDCPHTDTAFAYLYERYDAAGRFYVVQTPAYEDFHYTLVMKKTGKLYTVDGPPIWAPDKSRFLTVGCAIARDQKELVVHAPSGDGLVAEAEIPLPCESEQCTARWDGPSSISVSCISFLGLNAPRTGTQFTVQRGSEGTWKKSGL